MSEPTGGSFPGFSTGEMDRCFSGSELVGSMAVFEAELALALADVGIAPKEQADQVAEACRTPIDEVEAVLASTWETGTPVIALLRVLESRLSEETRRWLHHGATTQDVVDTALILRSKDAIAILRGSVLTTADHLHELTVKHRDQPQIARTFLQDAEPTTFGMRMATWLDTILRHLKGLDEAEHRLTVQIGGPVGNLSGFGEMGTDVLDALAGRLGLMSPGLPWHSDRSRVWELVGTVADLVRSLSKIMSDIVLLAHIGEIEVRGGASSSMAGKRNPIDAIRALAAAEVCRGAASVVLESAPHQLDRAAGPWHAEWEAVPRLFRSAAAVAEASAQCLASLEVSPTMGQGLEPPPIDPRLIDGVLERYRQLSR